MTYWYADQSGRSTCRDRRRRFRDDREWPEFEAMRHRPRGVQPIEDEDDQVRGRVRRVAG